MLRLLADENLNRDIVRGLVLRRARLDWAYVQEAGLRGEEDSRILAWAAENDRIVVTHDKSTMPQFAHERVGRGDAMPGMFVINECRPVSVAIDELLLMGECSEQWEWANVVVFLPL